MALGASALLAAAVLGDPRAFDEVWPLAWPTVLMVGWLYFASYLIITAERIADTFDSRAAKLLGDGPSTDGLAMPGRLRSTRHPLAAGIAFAGLGALIVWHIEATALWRATWLVTIVATFYYTGFGLWGSWLVSQRVACVARSAQVRGSLNIFHGDALCGLGFARRYADIGTMFMLTGAVALPMAVLLGRLAMATDSLVGWVVTAMVALAIAVWSSFAFLSSLYGRLAIAMALERYLDGVLDDVARGKKRLSCLAAQKDELELLNFTEAAALKVKTGVFTGAGGWKDISTIGIYGLALVDYARAVQDKLAP